MDSRKNWHSTLEEQDQERLRLRRKEWHAQQECERKHEERKLKMIEEYERKRAEAFKKKKSLCNRRSKSSSPQQRETSCPEHSKERKASVIVNNSDDIIDKKELHSIKISIHNNSSFPTKDQNTSNKIERDIVNPDDIIIPRRQNEGACPIFQNSEIKEPEAIRTITFSQNEQLGFSEKQSTRKNACTCKRLDISLHCDSSQSKSTICRDDRIDDDHNKYHDRRRSSTRDSKEKDRGRTERRDGSKSRYSSCSSLLTRNHSRSRYRNRSRSPSSEQSKEKRMDNDKNKFLSKSPDQSCELDNCVSLKPYTNHPFSDSFYNPYMRLPRPIPMPISMSRIQTPPVLMPVLPGFFSAPFPMNVHRWRQPSPNKYHIRFVNGRGTEIHTNRY